MNNEENFWKEINFFKHQCLFESFAFNSPDSLTQGVPVHETEELPNQTTREGLIRKIEDVIEKCIIDTSQGIAPTITFIRRTAWENISFQREVGLQLKEYATCQEVKFSSKASVKKFAITLHLLAKIYYLLQRNIYCTKRELFYQNVALYNSQSTVDVLVDDLACMFGVPRRELHILATSKGCIAGNLKFKDADGNYVNCTDASDSGVLVPNDIQGLENVESDAKVIIVVEKDATFQKLIEDNLLQIIHPCILITGKGFPDINTRELVHVLWTLLKIPVMSIVDADPYGIEILCTYKYGSLSLAHDALNLTSPFLCWLGVHPIDIERLNLPDETLLPLTSHDRQKIVQILKRPYIENNEPWAQQLQEMLRMGKKAEIESLYHIADNFLAQVYIPSKLRLGGWM